MTKKYCDICGKEIKNINETWSCTLLSAQDNKKVSYDAKIEEICERCANILHCCTSSMKQGLVPDFISLRPLISEETD